ncbi:alkaline phosphatase family protein [Peterkaempfera griseoplana]|uniref:alkaline phosphatase family protein n=1 Tax=Peterkaempfera griseoplana TaxID=66896 RepID=UPI0006E4133C|nr:alkaline phosphatase family protein [Peterkaempfera griseoplana]
MTGMTRRRLLGAAAATAAGAAAALLPPSVRQAVAEGPRSGGSLRDVKHVVLLMQENRSFDHYFGTMAGVRGFDDPDALRLPDGRDVFHQPDPGNDQGYLLPFHLDTRRTSAQAIPSTSHAWDVQHESWNFGRMDRWVRAHRKADGNANGPFTMGYYTREDIPFHYALAESFTVCDHYFCSVMGPTWPNRLYWMTGTIDPGGRSGGPVTTNAAPHPFRWTTYAERLQAAGISWQVYQEEDNYGCNMLASFDAFRRARPGDPLHERGLASYPAGTFEDDARNDRLPTVSWIIPTSYQCEHPDYLPAVGADYIASKIEAIASNPQVWAKTVFVLSYDENDGLFDHVRPPVPRPGTPGEVVKGLPIGAGFRVPCIIVSPWTVGGWVAGETFDHTSQLRFLERVTGVREKNITAWRRSAFGDLTSAFQFASGPYRPPRLPETEARMLAAEAEVESLPRPLPPTGGQQPPHQERGQVRRRTPGSG